jgi:hypothetical protein
VPIIGITITKETAFRESVQPFSNMYFFNNGIGNVPGENGAEVLLDELVNKEKARHSNLVEFTFGRVWLQTLLQSTTVMIFQKPLSGTGTASADAGMDKERAYLFRWRAGNDSRGNPVYLRKWYHTCGVFPGGPSPIPAGITANTLAFTAAQRTAMASSAAAMAGIGGAGDPWELCAKSGRGLTEGQTPESHRFLEHHQLGDQWRGA